jgi:hypothetical protein
LSAPEFGGSWSPDGKSSTYLQDVNDRYNVMIVKTTPGWRKWTKPQPKADGVLQSVVERDGATLDNLRERIALDELHRQVVRADVIERANGGMIERGNRPGFALKAVAEFARRDFVGDGVAERRVRVAVHLVMPPFPMRATISYGPSLSPERKPYAGLVHSSRPETNRGCVTPHSYEAQVPRSFLRVADYTLGADYLRIDKPQL